VVLVELLLVKNSNARFDMVGVMVVVLVELLPSSS
jgi:hypothetical protein